MCSVCRVDKHSSFSIYKTWWETHRLLCVFGSFKDPIVVVRIPMEHLFREYTALDNDHDELEDLIQKRKIPSEGPEMEIFRYPWQKFFSPLPAWKTRLRWPFQMRQIGACPTFYLTSNLTAEARSHIHEALSEASKAYRTYETDTSYAYIPWDRAEDACERDRWDLLKKCYVDRGAWIACRAALFVDKLSASDGTVIVAALEHAPGSLLGIYKSEYNYDHSSSFANGRVPLHQAYLAWVRLIHEVEELDRLKATGLDPTDIHRHNIRRFEPDVPRGKLSR